MTLKERQENFLLKVKKLYNDKYSLPYVYEEYKTIKSDITIICEKHGEVKVNGGRFLRGHGCPMCSKENRGKVLSKILKGRHQNQQEWIEYCTKKHNGKYDYSLVDFDNKREDGKVQIICHEKDESGNEHGVFWQLPNQHKWGKGCLKCKKLTTAKFKERISDEYKKNYDISLVKYKSPSEKVKVICKRCGSVFSLLPFNLLHERGCPFCKVDRTKEKLQLSLEEVKNRINEVFNNKYDLSKIKYVNNRTPIKVVCPIHGEFEQTPYMLFNGHGCQKCGQSSLENSIQIFLETNEIDAIYECGRKMFKWLGRQTLDFYLPKYNIAIECQGQQHFFPQKFGGITDEMAKKKFETTIKWDENKKKLCKENGIKLLYYSNLGIEYPYKVYENKEELLNEILKQNKND